MTCDGGTCYQGCAHTESAWAAKLAAAGEVAFQSQNAAIDLVAQLEAAEERARRLEEALRRYQWCGDYRPGYSTCPECDQTDVYGHAPDCRIGMLLAPPPGDEKKGGE